MVSRLCVLVAGVAIVAACHGNGAASDPNMNGGGMGTPGMYFRATPPLSPATVKSERHCSDRSADIASCRT